MDNIGGYVMDNKKISIIVFLLLTIFTINLISYEKIVDWENNEQKTEKIYYKGKNIIAGDKIIDKDMISYIVFNLSDDDKNDNEDKLNSVSIDELINRSKIMENKFHDSPLLVLYDDGIQKLNKDGTRYTRSRYAVKIMNEKYIDEYSVLSLYYIKEDYESKILMARSISPDGEVSYINESDISVTIPKQDLEFFSGRRNARIIKITIPNVKVGSIVDYEYEIKENIPEDINQFYTSWYFGGSNPVYESTVKFIVPEDKDFYWITKNFKKENETPVITHENDYKIYFFKNDINPPFIEEPYGPPIEDFYPKAVGSLFKDQTYLSNWLSKIMKERMIANDKMKEAVNAVINKSNAKSEEEKIAVLYRFVQEYIQYRSIKTSLSSGFSGHPAAETFENKYGDCTDKSILFATILNLIGVEAYPIIVMTNDKPKAYYDEIGIISGNHAINEIHLKENGKKIIYLDSTSLTYRYPVFRYDDQGILAWNPILNTVREIEPLDPVWNTQKYYKKIVLDDSGNAQIDSKTIYSGDWEAGIRRYFLSMKDKELKALLSTIISRDYPGSTLLDYDFRNPFDFSDNMYLSMNYKAMSIAKKSGNYYILNIPVKHDLDYITQTKRKYPVKLPTKEGKINSIEIKIPDEFILKGIPDPLKIDNDFFSYEGSYELKGNILLFNDHLTIKSCEIQVKDYNKIRSEFLKVDYFIRIPLILEMK